MEVDGGLRVLPSDVVPYVSSGAVDADLFDVEELLAAGYGDAANGLPLIVRYQGPAAMRARPLTAAPPTLGRLASIGGARAAGRQGHLGGRGPRCAAPAAAGPAGAGARPGSAAASSGSGWTGGSRPRWTTACRRSARPRPGRPAATARASRSRCSTPASTPDHPDLAGRIGEAQNFTGSGERGDGHGHGTHVASTIARHRRRLGRHAQGRRARRAACWSARCSTTAAPATSRGSSRAWSGPSSPAPKVVSMSLGGDADRRQRPDEPGGQRADRRDRRAVRHRRRQRGRGAYRRLTGRGRAALTVGAVDRDDNLADFSSRGPRLGDNGLKPEITAPGVGIVAARAAGTTMGTPVDDALHDGVGHLDGHPARGGRGRDPGPGPPGLDRREAQGRAGQHREGPTPR